MNHFKDIIEEESKKDYYKDLMMYVAIGLTALMFAEWILQLRDNM